MTHLETIDAFTDFAAGKLDLGQRALVERHLADCASCRSAFALLERTLRPGPVPQRLTADPFLPTRIRQIAEHRPRRRSFAPVVRWSFASVAFGAALVLGILLGSELPSSEPVAASASPDLVSEFAASLSTSDLGDRWYSAIETEGEGQK